MCSKNEYSKDFDSGGHFCQVLYRPYFLFLILNSPLNREGPQNSFAGLIYVSLVLNITLTPALSQTVTPQLKYFITHKETCIQRVIQMEFRQ